MTEEPFHRACCTHLAVRSGFRALEMTLAAAMALFVSACSTLGTVQQAEDRDLAWPPTQPRFRLERIVEDPRGSRGRGLLNRLTGVRRGSSFERPYDVAWDGEDLLVADPGARAVFRIAPKGRSQRSERGLFQSPMAVAACEQGIVVSDSRSGKVQLLDPRLRLIATLLADLERPTGVACSGSRLFVTETGRHRILSVDLGGAARSAEGSIGADSIRALGSRGDSEATFNYPVALAVDGSHLLVGDTLNFRLQRLDATSGESLGRFGRLGDAPGEMPRLKGVAVDSQRQVWVSDAYLDQVALFRSDGTFLTAFGGRGSAPGQFSFPAGIACDPAGRIAVADSFNRRIQVFRLTAAPGTL